MPRPAPSEFARRQKVPISEVSRLGIEQTFHPAASISMALPWMLRAVTGVFSKRAYQDRLKELGRMPVGAPTTSA
eukprot:2898837-Karenia_brevis.AAC.1